MVKIAKFLTRSISARLLVLALLVGSLPAWGATTNVSNGSLSHSQELLATRGAPLGLEMDLFYNSMYFYNGPLGPAWTHSYDVTLTDAGDGSKLLHEGESVRLYLAEGSRFTSQQPGDTSVLTLNGTGFLLTYRDGRKEFFGADGKITNIVDRYGNMISFVYAAGDLTEIADSAGQKVTMEYDSTVTPHRIKSICPPGIATSAPDTKKYTFEYDQTTGLLMKHSYPLADEAATVRGYWEYRYENGRLKTTRDPNGNVFTYNYYPDGRVKSSIDPEGAADANGMATVPGHTRSFVYNNEEGLVKTTTFTEKDGGVWSYVYDSYAGVLKQKIAPDPTTGAPGSLITGYAHYADGTIKAKTEPADAGRHLTTFYTYDSYGNRTGETEPIDLSIYTSPQVDPESVDVTTFATLTPPIKWAFSYTYDNYDRLLTETDLRGEVPLTTAYSYDSTIEPGTEIAKVTNPENKVFTYRFNMPGGTLKSVTDANNVSVTYDYYPNGLLSSVKDQNGVLTKFTVYDDNGNPKEIQKLDKTGKLLVTTVLEYDSINHLRKVTKTTTDNPPIITETKYDYDLMSNLALYTDPETLPTVKQTKYEYKYNGQVTKIIDPDLKETRFAYGGNGCASCGGGVDKLTEVKDAKQLANNWPGTTYVYDKLGRLEREIDARGKIIRYTYYDNGLVKDKIDASVSPEKNLITYEYNNRKQLTKKRVLDSSGSETNETTFSYDLNGNLQTAANKDMSYTFSWYKNGLLKSSTDINNNTISYEYDGAGNRTWMRAPDGMPFYTIYDEANRPDFYYTPAGIFEITYDDAGRRSKQTSGGFSTYYSYDGLDRLTHLLAKNMAGQNFTESVLSYDRAGNRKTRTAPLTEPGVSAAYEYDNLYRLTNTITTYPASTTREPYSYDEVGNRLTDPTSATPYSYSEGNQLDTRPGVTYSYDDYGNLKGKIEGTKTFIYNFDNENRLERVLITEQGGTITTVSFKYDPFDRRIEKKVTTQYPNNPVISAKVQTFLYDGDRILDATDSTWYPTRYVHGFFGIDDVLAAPILVSSTYTCQVYYDKDALGSVIRWNTGTQISYNAFGVPSSTTVSGYAYTGREYDSETGLYYYRARYYDPMVGRFISRDPLGFFDGPNRYAYVDSVGKPQTNLYAYTDNNPINFTDPLGLFSWGFGGTIGPLSFNWDSRNRTKTNIDLISDLQLGGGFKICFDHPFKDSCDVPKRSFDVNIGTGKWTGVTLEGNGGYCINIGLSEGMLPINISKTIN